jgi:signal transduction histidine kinase
VSLEGAVLAVVGVERAASEPLAETLRGAGATVTTAVVNADALSALSTPGFDATLLDVGDEPERFTALAAAIRSDPRTSNMPVFGLPSPTLAAARLAALGAVYVVSRGDDVQLARTLAEVVDQRRSLLAAADHARALEERLRVALERLSVMRSDAQTLTHDARVLCGVVVGFAANLRDGLAGPLDATQRGHVAQILEAATDTATMVERFGGAARAHTDLPSEAGALPSPTKRTARRTLLDLVDLTRATLLLFETVADQKNVSVTFDASEPVSLWGDSMQIKQVVTNLLVNALKFTPTGGRVAVAVRSVAPRGSASGPAARQHAELVVTDTGPGIPADQRERVFERGVRLVRDERIPGTGIGLAVVREIVSTHGGTARADSGPTGGAAMVVRLPLDMRMRREQSVLLVDDVDAARRILELLRSRRDWSRQPLRGDEIAVTATLESCRAVVVVPRGSRTALDDLLAPLSLHPPAPIDGVAR